ncbi:PTS sugar transporter subunit IIA [Calorimonas adulescens]|uniref:PTS sugar transporter subunit IIA n=1 Tax=Calorimonas adulescens TaxID=2606906 RepID=A0A5D8QER5_9THEO|nr:PTS sugar transporter subunit IIA [Calorimonas adulescens]TZE82991.1 PTS sugar transporter subunit IIA [Calorimonas adulescens]
MEISEVLKPELMNFELKARGKREAIEELAWPWPQSLQRTGSLWYY